MKSKLQDGDICELADGNKRIKSHNWLDGYGIGQDYCLDNYEEDLSRSNRKDANFDVISVVREGVVIWEKNQPINKMMTGEINGETYPLPTHENMKILVDKISELELRIKSLENAKA